MARTLPKPLQKVAALTPSQWLARRFWRHVDRSEPFGCWLWTGTRQNYELEPLQTYGRLKIEGRNYMAHRIAWMITYGTTRGLMVCHRCDVPLCVNPHHLALGTNEMNMQDARARGRFHTVWFDAEGVHDFYESTSLRDFLLDEDIRADIQGSAMLTAQRKRFDMPRMLSDRNAESATESNEWINPEGCDLEMEGENWEERKRFVEQRSEVVTKGNRWRGREVKE